MHAIARIRFDGGMLMLPSRTPYEIELLLENLDWYTARHEAVQLEIDNHRWRVAHGSSDTVEECARCHRARATLTFVNGRSEEHTSELQSRENLVCRLL